MSVGIAGGLRNRWAIQYAVEGDLRFISHQDTLRLFRRALTRAGLPLRYSEGFNPRPRIRIALPRPVGVASLSDLLLVELTADRDPDEILACLAAELPPGLRLRSVEPLGRRERAQPCRARYALPLEPRDCPSVARAVADFLARDSVVVRRDAAGGPMPRDIDIRVFIRDMEVAGGELLWTQALTPQGTARIGEVLEALGLSRRTHLHRVVRRSVDYEN